MSLLKKEYHSISESLFASKDVDLIFTGYCKEFLSEKDSVEGFVALVLNIIRDFLDRKIDEAVLSSLVNESLFDQRTKKYHHEPYLWKINDVLALFIELLDITWTKGSSKYKDYLTELGSRLAYLVEKYSN